MIWNLLTSGGEEGAKETAKKASCYSDPTSLIMLGALVLILVVWVIFSRRSQKKRQEEVQSTLNAIRPGNKVKTIGGICGIVVEVNEEDNTFVLETGSETAGKSYMKFDKQAVYQTDAVATPTIPATPVAEEKAEESEEVKEEPFEETKTEE
jgi:preprotein translocase subunit YajC